MKALDTQIKTLEHYVLTKLEDLEAENHNLKQENENFRQLLKEADSLFDLVKSRMTLDRACTDPDEKLVRFDNVWDKHEPEVFKKLVEEFNLTLKEDNDNE